MTNLKNKFAFGQINLAVLLLFSCQTDPAWTTRVPQTAGVVYGRASIEIEATGEAQKNRLAVKQAARRQIQKQLGAEALQQSGQSKLLPEPDWLIDIIAERAGPDSLFAEEFYLDRNNRLWCLSSLDRAAWRKILDQKIREDLDALQSLFDALAERQNLKSNYALIDQARGLLSANPYLVGQKIEAPESGRLTEVTVLMEAETAKLAGYFQVSGLPRQITAIVGRPVSINLILDNRSGLSFDDFDLALTIRSGDASAQTPAAISNFEHVFLQTDPLGGFSDQVLLPITEAGEHRLIFYIKLNSREKDPPESEGILNLELRDLLVKVDRLAVRYKDSFNGFMGDSPNETRVLSQNIKNFLSATFAVKVVPPAEESDYLFSLDLNFSQAGEHLLDLQGNLTVFTGTVWSYQEELPKYRSQGQSRLAAAQSSVNALLDNWKAGPDFIDGLREVFRLRTLPLS